MSKVSILTPVQSQLKLSLYETTIPAGFPSSAEEYLGDTMGLNDYLIKNSTVSFLAKIEGGLMVVRSLTAKDNGIVIAAVDNEFTIKCLFIKKGIRLIPANKNYQPLVMSSDIYYS